MKTKFGTIRNIVPYVLLWGLLLCGNHTSKGQTASTIEYNLNGAGVMLDGYDLVSYFIGTVAEGKSMFKYNHEGVEFWFASQENRQIFIKNPEKFLPAYGGWCAYAMAEDGEKVKIDPETYKIIDGSLYLFYNFYFNNTLIKWNKDELNFKKKADENWLMLISQ